MPHVLPVAAGELRDPVALFVLVEPRHRLLHPTSPPHIQYTRPLSTHDPSQRLRVAAIDFLNPAPLMWDFEHPPLADELATRYVLHYTRPSQCAAEVLSGRADLGLIPIAALTPDLAIVPGCTIASLDRVRSIQLILGPGQTLESVQTVAADTASRSSLAYAEILLRKFSGSHPEFFPAASDPIAMLQQADAAVLIGDPALVAVERREEIEAVVGRCTWIDLAHEWRSRTGLPWVAAVWAARPEALHTITATGLVEDLAASRDHGLGNVEQLVEEWTPRIAVAPATIREYLTKNIHYTLDDQCIRTIEVFRQYAAECEVLPPLPRLRFLL